MLPEAYSKAAQCRVPLLALILVVTLGISSSTAQEQHEDFITSASNLLSWPLKAGQAEGAKWRKWQNPYEVLLSLKLLFACTQSELFCLLVIFGWHRQVILPEPRCLAPWKCCWPTRQFTPTHLGHPVTASSPCSIQTLSLAQDGPKRQQRKLLQASANAPAVAIMGVQVRAWL